MVGDMLEFIKTVWVSVSTETGVTSGLLFLWGIYQTLDNRSLRRQIKNMYTTQASELKELNGKIYDMGIKQVSASAESNTVLEKISQAVSQAFSSKKGRNQ